MKGSKIKKILFDEKGSALILVMVILISGILIFSSITSISLLQRSAGSKVRSSTEALQIADSCMEWTLMRYYGAAVDHGGHIDNNVNEDLGIGEIDVNGIFTPYGLENNGEVVDVDGMVVVDTEEYSVGECRVYLIKDDGVGGDDPIDNDTDLIEEIIKIRSIGVAGFGDDKTTRAFQVTLHDPSAP